MEDVDEPVDEPVDESTETGTEKDENEEKPNYWALASNIAFALGSSLMRGFTGRFYRQAKWIDEELGALEIGLGITVMRLTLFAGASCYFVNACYW